MIYFAGEFKPQDRSFSFGSVRGITLGEIERERKTSFLPTPKQAGRVLTGPRKDLSLGATNSGRPRINHKKDTKLSLVLSSRPGSKFDGHQGIRCTISVPPDQRVFVVSYGLSGRRSPCSWEEALLRVRPGDIFLVDIESSQRHEQTFYMVGNGEVVIARDLKSAEDAYRDLLDALDLSRPCLESGLSPWSWRYLLADHVH